MLGAIDSVGLRLQRDVDVGDTNDNVADTRQRHSSASATNLRACHIISSFHPVVGGAERATQTLVQALRRRDNDVIVFTRRYERDLPRYEQVEGIPVYRLGWPGRGKFHALTFGLHTLTLLAWRFRDRRTIHVQNIDTPMLTGLLARLLLRRVLVATIHGHTPILAKNLSLRGRIRTWVMARAVDAFTSINPENTRSLLKLGVPRSRVHEIPNGVDMDVFRPPSVAERAAARVGLDLLEDEFVAVYIGRLVPLKRLDLLISAWGRMDPAERGRLLIVGDGPEAPSLRAQASASGPDIRLEGASSQPVTHLWAADVFVNPSGDNRLASEGLSVALLEAMAAGIPPVATQGPGNDVLVDDGVTGLSFPVEDGHGLEGCLRRLRGDSDLRRRLGRTAHDQVRRTYSIDTVAAQVESLYRSLGDGISR
jgi:glycosyltransferase involved in cell wall biosynthesis